MGATSSLNQDEWLELDKQARPFDRLRVNGLRNLLLEGAQSKPTGLADHHGKLEFPCKFALNRLVEQ